MYRKLIREQAPPPTTIKAIQLDELLDRAYKVKCFPGFEPVTTGYNGKAALGKWVDNNTIYVYIQTDPENKNIFLVTEVDKNGNNIPNQPPYQQKCDKITGNVFEKEGLRPDQEKVFNELKDRKFLTKDDPNGKVTTHDWVDINTDKDVKSLINPELLKALTGGQPFMMWKPKSFGMDYEDVNEEAKKYVDYLIGKGWQKRPELGKEGNFIKCDLKNTSNQPTQFGENCYKGSMEGQNIYVPYFAQTQGYTLYMPKNFSLTASSDYQIVNYQVDCNDAKTDNFNKPKCEKCIDSYFRATKAGVGKSPDRGFPEIVDACLAKNNDNFPRYRKVINYLRGDGLTSQLLPWKIKNTNYKQKKDIFGTISVNEDKLLKKTILESLESVKEQKRKKMIESVILENRLKVLSEKKNLRNKKDFDIFLNNFLTETADFNAKGFNQELLSEQFTDMLTSFFQGPGLGGVFGYVKEYAVKWLLGKLGLGTNNWIADVVSTTIGNLPIGDIAKITDCNFIVPKLSKSIAETIAKRFITTSKDGNENQIAGVVRNTVFEVIDDVPFVQALETGLAGIICPIWDQLVGKLDKVSNKITQTSSPAIPSQSSLMNSAQSLISNAGNIMNLGKNAASNLTN